MTPFLPRRAYPDHYTVRPRPNEDSGESKNLETGHDRTLSPHRRSRLASAGGPDAPTSGPIDWEIVGAACSSRGRVVDVVVLVTAWSPGKRVAVFWKALGVSPGAGVIVIVSAVVIYLALLVLVRLIGQRAVARLSTFDVVVLLVLGSAGGRVITGSTPTAAAGAIALATLLLVHWVGVRVMSTRAGGRLLTDRAVLLMAGGERLDDNLRRVRIGKRELHAAIRTAGVRNLQEVACVVLESTGTISVLKTGVPLDRDLLADVHAHEQLPDHLFEV